MDLGLISQGKEHGADPPCGIVELIISLVQTTGLPSLLGSSSELSPELVAGTT